MRSAFRYSSPRLAAGITATFLTATLIAGTAGCSKDSEPGKATAEKKTDRMENKGKADPAEKKSGKIKKTAGPPLKAENVKTKRAAGKKPSKVSPDRDSNSPASQIVRRQPPPPPENAAKAAQIPAEADKAPAPARKTVKKKIDHLRPPIPDPRLLLTLVDVASAAPPKTRFKRVPLAGSPRTTDTDSILYAPEKGGAFGFSLQLFRSRNALETKRRFESLQASYPSSQEITPVSGKTFFSYWNEILHIGFVYPTKNLTIIVSCGRKYCVSDKLMIMAGKVAERLR